MNINSMFICKQHKCIDVLVSSRRYVHVKYKYLKMTIFFESKQLNRYINKEHLPNGNKNLNSRYSFDLKNN